MSYRRLRLVRPPSLVTDAERCLKPARDLPGIYPSRVVLARINQGGGLAIATSGLVPGVAATLADAPFLGPIRRGVEVADNDPYQEMARYLAIAKGLVAQAFRTLDYIDGVHHAALVGGMVVMATA